MTSYTNRWSYDSQYDDTDDPHSEVQRLREELRDALSDVSYLRSHNDYLSGLLNQKETERRQAMNDKVTLTIEAARHISKAKTAIEIVRSLEEEVVALRALVDHRYTCPAASGDQRKRCSCGVRKALFLIDERNKSRPVLTDDSPPTMGT